MAMDREKLLVFFQAHYLSRQEVLFKLPLNISIDSFWPELLNRRKSRATVLPLCNAAGMPYWYVLTDRMVAASERLCEEALGQDTEFDPYRAGMTSAMTEEMFFTSFVEGAQIPLQEAMDFLQRGTEPESIHEQMIWNNRHAWAEMIGMLYRPLDESFVRAMAFILTEEMDNCAEDYRQTDQHAIAAMNNEPYEVPPAYSLPDRMREYYEFLQKTDVHPLIKAAVAQAFLLVTRPFPEGNKRLSRMMSSAVLLRCGYDFFRDISISAMIAKESYRYYKCMCEIIRSENGGDLTYFMEYFLELLVRAIDARKERLRRREQESLEREREMAGQPLKKADEANPVENMTTIASQEIEDGQLKDTAHGDTQEGAPDEETPAKRKKAMPIRPMELDKLLNKIDKLRCSRIEMNRAIPPKVRIMAGAGLFVFTVQQWSDATGTDIKQSDYECRFLHERGYADCEWSGNRYVYALRVIAGASGNGDVKRLVPAMPSVEAQGGVNSSPFEAAPATGSTDTVAGESPPTESDFHQTLKQMEESTSERVRRSASIIREMLAEGITHFTRVDWSNITGMDWKNTCDACDYLVSHKLVLNATRSRKQAEYIFTLPGFGQVQEENGAEVTPEEEYSPLLIALLQKMVAAESRERDQRIGGFILNMLDNDIERITTEDWEGAFHVSKPVLTADLRRAVNLGLLRKENPRGLSTHCTYVVPKGPYSSVRCVDLTKTQKEMLGKLYSRFKKKEFTVHEAARAIGRKEASIDFHLANIVERGLMICHEHPEKPGCAQGFTFAIFPKEHPQCFKLDARHSASPVGSGYAAEPVPLAAASA